MSTTKSADDWVRAALSALRDDGANAIAVQALARRLGVTKGSFYWHFESRRALLDAVLATWEDVATEAVIAQVDAATDTPGGRIRALIDATFGADDGYGDIESGIRTWAASDATAAQTVERVDHRRLAYVVELLVEAGVSPEVAATRADLFYRALIGEWAYRSHGGSPLDAAALGHLADLVTSAT